MEDGLITVLHAELSEYVLAYVDLPTVVSASAVSHDWRKMVRREGIIRSLFWQRYGSITRLAQQLDALLAEYLAAQQQQSAPASANVPSSLPALLFKADAMVLDWDTDITLLPSNSVLSPCNKGCSELTRLDERSTKVSLYGLTVERRLKIVPQSSRVALQQDGHPFWMCSTPLPWRKRHQWQFSMLGVKILALVSINKDSNKQATKADITTWGKSCQCMVNGTWLSQKGRYYVAYATGVWSTSYISGKVKDKAGKPQKVSINTSSPSGGEPGRYPFKLSIDRERDEAEFYIEGQTHTVPLPPAPFYLIMSCYDENIVWAGL